MSEAGLNDTPFYIGKTVNVRFSLKAEQKNLTKRPLCAQAV